MRQAINIDDLVAAYAPTIRSLPSNKPRDPNERMLLQRLGDPNVWRETDALVREAGARQVPGHP